MCLAVYRRAHFLDGLNSCVSCLFHSLSENDRICARCQVLHAFVDHRLSEDGSCGSAVARHIIGLCRDFLDQLCAHVLEIVLEFDFLCDRDTVVSDRGCAVGLIQNNVSALGAECDLYCICEFVDSGSHRYSCVCAVLEIFCHIVLPLFRVIFAVY